MKRFLRLPIKAFLCILFIPVVFILRLISPWFLVRWGELISTRIGHLAGNTEIYLCEQDAGINVPKQSYIDLHFMGGPICNQQLATMWKRVLHVWPAWILGPISWVNRLVPGGRVHEIGDNTLRDRDVHNLLERFQPHLKFTLEEDNRGKAGLISMGVPQGARFVCLIVRDSAYLAHQLPYHDWSYHNFRDCNIQNFVLAAEEIADRGYFLIRMGAKVEKAIQTSNPRVIDYAMNSMRSDFMDIYLGANCEFCISTGLGFDAVPYIFRRPIVYVNYVPFASLVTFSKDFISITKKHVFVIDGGRSLTLSEIFSTGVGFGNQASDYESRGVKLIENTPEEIRDVVIEMSDRLNGIWKSHKDDEVLQRIFWKIFPIYAVDKYQGTPMHGEIRSRFGANFLRNNREFLQ